MAHSGTQGEIYRFGAFEFAAGRGELRKNGLRLKLQDQPLRILTLLLENAGEVVTREQIQKRLWADDIHVDYENAINSAVRKLREVLIDTSENPRFVETLARRGYRFVAPVTRVSSAPVLEESPVVRVEVPAPAARKRNLYWIWPVVASAAIAAFWFWPGRNGVGPPQQAVPLTSFPGYESWPSFSPDGNQVAFAWNGEKGDNYDIYVKLIGSGRPLRLTANPTAHSAPPVWSPDGRSIALRRFDKPSGNMTIQLIPALGGAEREVAQLGNATFASMGGWSPDAGGRVEVLLTARATFASMGGWSPDGHRLLISWADKTDEPSKLFWVSVDTGEKRRITSPPPATTGDQFGIISPDGHTVAFARTQLGNPSGLMADLYTLPLNSDLAPAGEPRRLTFDNTAIKGIAWTADSREIVFSSTRGGSVALWRMPISGSEKPWRLGFGDNGTRPAISVRSNRLVYEQTVFPDTNIWRVDLSDPALPAASFIASTRDETNPQYSPDGRRIAFRSARSGNYEIWVCDADASNPVQLTNRGVSGTGSPRWSPDGRLIAFDSPVDGHYQVFVMAANGSQQQQLTHGVAAESRPSWSHDGKWLYFTSTRSGRYEIWKIPAGGGTAAQVTRNGGNDALESEDGVAIYYDLRGTIMKAALDGSGEIRIVDAVVGGYSQNFVVTRDGIYYVASEPDNSLWFLSLANGKSRRVWKAEKPLHGGISVSPDSRWLLYTQLDGQAGSDLMLVENFH